MTFQNSFNNILTQGLKVALGSDATGDLYYRDSSGFFTRLALGTSGQALIAGGTIPFWGNPSPGGNAGGALTGTYPNPDIADAAVTLPKIQNIASGLILGRSSAGTGVVEALSASSARSVLGLGTVATLNTGTAAGNIPILGTGGLLDPSVMPPISLTSIQVVTDQAARLALINVQPGDLAKQTDNGQTYVLQATPPSTNSNWVAIGDTAIDGADIQTGFISTSRLGTGTPTAGTYLDGTGAWSTPNNGLPFTMVTGTTANMSANNGYITNNASRVILTLPTTAAFGSIIKVVGMGAGGWRIAQNASQQIQYLSTVSTVGASGRVDTEMTYTNSFRACAELVCVVANTTWIMTGNGTLDVV